MLIFLQIKLDLFEKKQNKKKWLEHDVLWQSDFNEDLTENVIKDYINNNNHLSARERGHKPAGHDLLKLTSEEREGEPIKSHLLKL